MYEKPTNKGKLGRIRVVRKIYNDLIAKWEDPASHFTSGDSYVVQATSRNIEIARKHELITESEEQQARTDLSAYQPGG